MTSFRWLLAASVMFLSVGAAWAQQERLPDPNSLIDAQFPDNPQKIKPLAQDYVAVATSPDPETIWYYDPYVLALPGGRLIGGYSIGGSGADEYCKKNGWIDEDGKPQNAVVMTSDDHGQTWTERAHYRMWHQRAFEAGGHIYILGHMNDLRIMRSDDNGETWTEPVQLTEGQTWHQSAVGYWKANGNIYIVMERRLDRDIKGWQVANVAPVLMRASLRADLLKRESWTFASELVFMDFVDQSKINYVGIPYLPTNPTSSYIITEKPRRGMAPMGWLETNVVQVMDPNHIWFDPTGHTFHLLGRCNTGGTNIATLCKVVENPDGSMTTMLEQAPSGKDMLFIPLPGGQMKFYVLYDKKTQLYWLLSSQSTDSMIDVKKMDPRRWNLPNQERHRLVLHFSRNLYDWCFAGVVAIGPDMNAARHYACMDIDGDDLVIMSRSGDEHAHDAHNGDLTTFHRVKNFRGLVY